MTTTVRDNADQHRFEIVVDDEVAGFADYRLADDRITFTHTEVDDEYAGQGLAKQLVVHALDEARSRQIAVVPECSYVARTIAKDTDRFLDLVPENARGRLQLDGS